VKPGVNWLSHGFVGVVILGTLSELGVYPLLTSAKGAFRVAP
jgi:hypothetical protein